MAYLNNIQLRILSEFLDSPARPEGTMTLHELRGFLWGLASAPVDVDEDEWFPFIFDDEDANFTDTQEEENISILLLGLWDEQLTRLEDDDSPLAASEYHWHEELEKRWPLAAWCTGLLKAHYWLEDPWQELLAQTEPVETEDGTFDIKEEIESCLDIASLFSDLEATMDESDDPADLLASMPEIAEQLPWIMMNYAECGCLLAEMQEAKNQEPYQREQPKIGRNDPCFCGSGKKYKHCCLNAANDD
jgi:uncharacterized protein